MKVPTFNSKADWRFNAQFLQTDPVTKVQTPIDLTGSRLRVVFAGPDGTVAGSATTESGIAITAPLEGRIAAVVPVAGRAAMIGGLPLSLIGDVYRSADGSDPTEWIARIPATLVTGA